VAKTSTACFETQKITQYNPSVILVHSESKTPNVPYGEHFSTVNQICITWESEGRTRIKCFTEVKFKRSIMWSSKVEAGSLEGSGGFYKEFIRNFEQLVESQRDQLLSSYEARLLMSSSSSPSLVSSPVAGYSDGTMSTTARTSESNDTHPFLSLQSSLESTREAVRVSERTTIPVALQEPERAELQEMSRARSLLSQQFLRHPPLSTAAAGLPRLSLDSARPSIVGASFVPQKSPLSISVLPLKKRSAISDPIQSLTPPTYPIVPLAREGLAAEGATALEPPTLSAGADSPITQASFLPPSSSSHTHTSSWMDFVRRNISLLGRSSLTEETAQHLLSLPSSGLSSPPTPTFGHASGRAVERTGSPRVTFAVSTFPPASSLSGTPRSAESPPSIPKDRSIQRQTRQDSDHDHIQHHRSSRRLSKVLFGFVVLGLVVSALNIWHLFSVVSSMVEVVRLKDIVFQRQFHPPHAPDHHHHKCRPSQSVDPMFRKRAGTMRPWKPSLPPVPPRGQQHSRPCSSSARTRTSSRSPSFTAPRKPTIRDNSSQKHLLDDTLLGPLQIQTAILRTEITELFDLLEQARKELHQPHHQHNHRS
jgi:hypothetical protein